MLDFYMGKTCIISKSANGVEWAHIMDATLETSNINVNFQILSGMLTT